MNNELERYSHQITTGILLIVKEARKRVAVYVNKETTELYWEIGRYINDQILLYNRAQYGATILATVSQQLMVQLGKGYTYTALTRMSKVAKAFAPEKVATLSQQLSWSHFTEH